MTEVCWGHSKFQLQKTTRFVVHGGHQQDPMAPSRVHTRPYHMQYGHKHTGAKGTTKDVQVHAIQTFGSFTTGGECGAYRQNHYATWYSRLYVCVLLLRRESSVREWGSRLSILALGLKGADSRTTRGGEPAQLPLTTKENHFCWVTVGQSSCCSQVMCLALSVPHMPASAHSTESLSQDCGVWRVLNATDVGYATQGQGVPDHQVSAISGAQNT